VWFKNRRAKCRQQQKAAEQVSKTASVHVHHQHQQRPDSVGSISNTSPTAGAAAAVHVPPGGPTDGDANVVTSATGIDDVTNDDDRLVYRHDAGGLLVAAESRPSCGWMPPLLRQSSSDTFAGGSYRVAPRLYSAGPSCHRAAAMFAASRSAGYPVPSYNSELGGYGSPASWNAASVPHDDTAAVYAHRGAGHETSGGALQFASEDVVGSTSAAGVSLFVTSAYDHAHHHHQHIQHYHEQHAMQLRDHELDEDDEEETTGDYEVAESSRRAAVQSTDENKDWIKYQPL